MKKKNFIFSLLFMTVMVGISSCSSDDTAAKGVIFPDFSCITKQKDLLVTDSVQVSAQDFYAQKVKQAH